MAPTPLIRRRLLIVAAILAAYSIIGFFILPPIARSQLEERLSVALGRRVTVERVRVNPYTLSVTLEDFSIRERDGTTPFLGWRRLYARADALSPLRGEWGLSEISLDGFNVRVLLDADQSPNFSDVLAKLVPPRAAATIRPPKSGWGVRVGRMHVSDARVDFSDLSRKKPFSSTLGPMTFAITDFHTIAKRGAPYNFAAVTESGEKLDWSGTLQAEPLRSEGELSLENIVLPKYAPYYTDLAQADVAAGLLSVRGHYDFDLADGQRVLRLRDGAVRLRGLRLVERATRETAVELPSLDVTGIEADALKQKATISSVSVSGGHMRLRRGKDGSINLLGMLRPPNEAPSAARPAAPRTPDVGVGELAVNEFKVEVDDLAAPRPVHLAMDGIRLSLKKFSFADGARMPLQLGFNWAPHGSVRLDGDIGISPAQADLKVAVDGLDIRPLGPYLESFANAHVTQGSVTSTISVKASLPDSKPLDVTAAGDVLVENFGLVDSAHNEELAGFGELRLQGLSARTAPKISVVLGEVAVTGPYARVTVGKDGSMNLSSVLGAGPPAAGSTAGPSAASPPAPKIEIGKVSIGAGNFRFTDRSLEPNVTVAVNQFGGTIAGLSSMNHAKADLDLTAMVEGAGPVAIVGRLDPLGPVKAIDLNVDVKNVDLLPLSPYSGKFAGYELASGKLLLDVKLVLEDKRLDATNMITLNQFAFGGAVRSPDATGLPVRLAVALLKDLDGKIVIDVPVQGSIDDPSFKVGRVVLRVIVNLLTKAATSPFSLIGSMFGGGGDELAFQEFLPGGSELQAAEKPKLATLAKALANRQGLSLGIEGDYDLAADAYALKRQKLADLVRRRIWEARRADNPNIPPPGQLQISPEDNAAFVGKLFNEQFPPGTQFGTPLPPAPTVVAPPPPPSGLFKRIIAAITFQASRDRRAAEQESARQAAAYKVKVSAAVAAGLPLEEMTGRLAEATVVTDDDLRALAAARAKRVRDYLIETGHIAADRLFLAQGMDAKKQNRGPRVFLALQ